MGSKAEKPYTPCSSPSWPQNSRDGSWTRPLPAACRSGRTARADSRSRPRSSRTPCEARPIRIRFRSREPTARASASSESGVSSLRARQKNPSRRRRRYGPGSPCSLAALTAMPAGWELWGGSSSQTRASTGISLWWAAWSTSKVKRGRSSNSRSMPPITYSTASSSPNSASSRRKEGSSAQDHGQAGSVKYLTRTRLTPASLPVFCCLARETSCSGAK